MNLTTSLFSAIWHWVAVIISAGVVVGLVRSRPWKRLKTNSQRNLFFGFAVTIALLWNMKAGVQPGLNLHILGAMAATLALGPGLAIGSLGLALVGLAANDGISWSAWPINFVLMVVVPVGFAECYRRLVERALPAHFFVFIFLVAFLGSAITVMAQGALSSIALALADAYTMDFLVSDYLPYFLLLGFSEAWLSGAIITLLVVYKPEWVFAFDDLRYLRNK